jgi:hypothetical protein
MKNLKIATMTLTRAIAKLFKLAGYGACTQCNCPGFIGSTYTCTRGDCGHHYDSHS